MKNSILRLILVFCCSISFQVGHSQEISKSHYVSAKEYLKKDSVRLALAELDSATQISPNFSEAYMLKGQIWESKENYRKAIGQYSLAILYDPKLTQAYLRRAELHFKLKDHRDYVLYDVGEAIRFDPENAEFYALKAYYYAHTISPETLKPDYENAIRSITHAIQLNPENALYFKERSEYKFRYEQPLSALADIDKAIEKDDSNDSYYYHRGFIRFMMGNYRSSLPDLSRAIELNAKVYSYFQLRGNALYNMGRYDRAYNDYSSTIDLLFMEIARIKMRLSPDDPLNLNLRQTLMLRGMTLVQENKPYDGCDDFERALQMGESKAANYIRKYCQ